MTSKSLPRSTPEAQGIASDTILGFVDAVEQNQLELHSLMLVRHGQVVAEGWWKPYGPDLPHMLYSLSKSFTSTAAGLAIAEGRFSLDDTVLSFFPDDAPSEISNNLAAMRVRHLLSMSTGHAVDPTGRESPDGNWVRTFLAQPVEHEPGTHFVYNSVATYMAAAIVEKTTGTPLLEYLQSRLLGPLGIVGATWETCPRGIAVGGWGLNVTTEDIARFGQLYLQKGVWEGERLLPEAWVEEATSYQVANGDKEDSDWSQGYGYQFWRCRHGAYRGDGAFGQYCIVLPEQDAVLALTSGVGDMQAVLNLVWERLLPAMGSTSYPEDGAAQAILTQRLENLALDVPQGEPTSPTAAQVSGRLYRLAPNDEKIETIRFDFSANDESVLILQEEGGKEHQIVCGNGVWKKGTNTFQPLRCASQPTQGYGVWTEPETYVLRLCYYETPFCPTITCRFTADAVTVDLYGNIGFGPKERPPWKGIPER